MGYYTYTQNPVGAFQEKDTGNWFEYSVNDDALNSINEDFLHKIWIGDAQIGGQRGYRYGTVQKTRLVICVDEDEFGLPVLEKWYTKKHNVYG